MLRELGRKDLGIRERIKRVWAAHTARDLPKD